MIAPVISGFVNGLYAFRQAIFAAVLLLIILAFYSKISHHPVFNAVGLTSIGATMCLIFLSPPSSMSEPKVIFIGYIIGISTGLGCYYLAQWLIMHPISIPVDYYSIGCTALTLMICILLMALFRAPHPPAAGFSLGIMVDQWDSPLIILSITGCAILILFSIQFSFTSVK